MTCYHPIKAFIVDENGTNRKFHFASCDKDYIVYNHQKIEKYVLLPCGKCIGCRVDQSREWANRMMLELKYHDCACFITLTYDDDNLPMNQYVDENGEVQLKATLRKTDFQEFMKRLRWHIAPKRIRFFSAGEYGGKTERPHYHAIIFGYDFPDKREWMRTKDGYIQYRSELLEKIWPFGFSMICEVNWNTCAYVSRYCTKKIGAGRNIYYQTFNIEPEFNTMSRRPGLGRKYYDEHKDEVYIKSDEGVPHLQEIFLSNNKGGLKISPPKYFDRLYEKDEPFHMDEIKARRKEIAENELDRKLRESGKSMREYLEVQEIYFKERVKSLRRDKI